MATFTPKPEHDLADPSNSWGTPPKRSEVSAPPQPERANESHSRARQDLSTEGVILAIILGHPEAFDEHKDRLHDGLFRQHDSREIFEAIKSVAAEAGMVDDVSVRDFLTGRGSCQAGRILDLSDRGFEMASAMLEHHIETAQKHFIEAQRKELSEKAKSLAADGDLEGLKSLLAEPPTSKPVVYFENNRGRYWLKDATGCFRTFSKADATSLLRKRGYRKDKKLDEVSPILDDALVNRGFDIPLRLPAYEVGITNQNGQLIFVPSETKLIQPVEGDWPILREIWVQTLGKDQFRWFYFWLSTSIKGIYSGEWQPSPVVALIGPTGAFKSFSQAIITKLLGDCEARVVQAVTGATSFNSDWAEASHLVIEDDFSDNSRGTRQRIKESIKAVAVNAVHRIHPKGQPAFSLRPFWRMTISCNPIAESLSVLPEIDDSVRGKLSLLWASRAESPIPTSGHGDRARFMAAIEAELPALVHDLLNSDAVPHDLRDPEGRSAVRAWHDPMAMEVVQYLSPDGEMLQLIDESIDLPFSGTASDLLRELKNVDAAGRHSSRSLGRLLVRLCESHSSRVTRTGSNNHDRAYSYRILPRSAELSAI
ncbi:MAG: DnaB-like helicase N-terminal domain-containing protein [Puniceicoccales bacterium]